MHPMKLITYALLIGVATLVAMGGIGFYVGYSAGRGDLSEMKKFLAASASPESAAALAEALKQGASKPAAAPEVNLNPVLEEIRAMNAQIGKLEQATNAAATAAASAQRGGVVDRLEKIKDDPKLREELAVTKQKLSAATEQYNTCRQDLGAVQSKLEAQMTSAQQVALASPKPQAGHELSAVLYDNVVLKRDQNKVYNDVDIALSLQSVASRSARVVVNQQAFAIAFGERKIVKHNDVTCELVLMETDLDVTQARVSISCKR
jgi:hypothetical protein